MTLTARIVLAALIVTAFGGVVAYLSAGGAGDDLHRQGKVRWESSQQCKECHPAVFAEWQGSHHQIAYTNPEVRKLSDDFRKEECMDCHLPRPLAVTGFGKRTLPRRTHFDEGISCITCHLGKDGGILARNDRPEVPCKPTASVEFLSVDACESCHNQHGTTDQFRASRFAKLGNDCSTCHMPEIERVRKDGSKRRGRMHVYKGCHDEATLKSAATFAAERDGDELVLSLTNTGAAHNFPTEERHRAVDMVYRFVTADGPGEWQRAYRFRQPYRDEMEPINPGNEPGENTQLPDGVTKSVRVAIPDGALHAEARLWYRLTPFVGDDSDMSTMLFEEKVTW